MIEIWFKDEKWMVLRPEQKTDWYLKYNFEWKCWTIAGWNHYELVSRGWERKE